MLVSFLGISSNQDFLQNWGAVDYADEPLKGVAFVGHHGGTVAAPQRWPPPFELSVVDATADPEEPSISRISESNLGSVDRQLRNDLSKEYDIVDWRGSKIRRNKCGLKTLVTRYSHCLDGNVYDVYAVRQELLFEKLVMLTAVDANEADRLRGPLDAVLRRIVLS